MNNKVTQGGAGKKPSHRKRLGKGFTLLEVLFASAILGISVIGVASFQNVVFKRTTTNNERAFAMERTMQMFEELRTFVQGNKEDGIQNLNNFSDGSAYNKVLTTTPNVTNPADLLSSNSKIPGTSRYRYVRQIQILPVPNDVNARQVTVTVWRTSAANDSLPENIETPLASITGILKTNISNLPPTQVFDIFMVSIANAPGWWIDLADVRPMFETTLNDIESRNPGLRYRRHYITDLGYGRDPYYLPYINNADDTDDQTLPWTYFYPGKIDQTNGDGALDETYVLYNIKGRIREDHTKNSVLGSAPSSINGMTLTNHPIHKTSSYYSNSTGAVSNFLSEGGDTRFRKYALADRWNHVMRYPELKAMKTRLQNEQNAEDSGSLNKRPPLEPTLTELLEDLNTNPDNYKNAIIINLHGEMLPVPPLRNYSDAAKLIEDDNSMRNLDLPNKRLVTHPEFLQYPNTAGTVNFRVYPYETVSTGSAALPAPDPVTDNIYESTLFLPTHNSTGLDSYNPIISSPATGLFSDDIRKLVGDATRPYVWKTRDNIHSCYYRVTSDDSDDSASNNNSTIYLGNTANSDTANRGRLATNGIYRSGNTLRITLATTIARTVNCHSNTNAATSPDNTKDRLALKGQWIVISDSNANAGNPVAIVARVQDVAIADVDNAPSGINLAAGDQRAYQTLTIDTSSLRMYGSDAVSGTSLLNTYFSAPSPATPAPFAFSAGSGTGHTALMMHRDFTRAGNPTLFGSMRDGVTLTLYNTPTRHPQYTSSGTGQYGGLYHGSGSDADITGDTRRLYRMEYIPTPIQDTWGTISQDATPTTPTSGASIAYDLTSTSQQNAKNTARWVVPLDVGGTVFDNRRIMIETRIGLELEDGISADGNSYQPDQAGTTGIDESAYLRRNLSNVSRTYTYIGDTVPNNSEEIPITEKFQFLGDPRYNPYLDVKSGKNYLGTVTTVQHRYNRHFYRKRCTDGTELTAFGGKCNDTGNSFGYLYFDRHNGPSWSGDDVDLNWLFYLYSNGIMTSNAVYNSISGWNNYYYTIGGEMGTDGTNASFDVRRQPWSQDSEGSNNIANTNESDSDSPNDITGFTHDVFQTSTSAGSNDNNRWFAMPWIGELVPDTEYNYWRTEGNLPNRAGGSGDRIGSANASNTYFMGNYNLRPLLLDDRETRIAGEGCASFMNGNTTGTGDDAFRHTGGIGSSLGNLTKDSGEAGRMLSDAFNLALPNVTDASRPFKISGGGSSGSYTSTEVRNVRNTLNFINSTNGATGTSASDINNYYRDASDNSWTSSAIVRMTRAGDGAKAGYMLVNGLSHTGEGGKPMIARISLAGMLQTYMDAGDFSSPGDASGRTVPLPRVNITNPKPTQIQDNPSTITVNFSVSWKRWDDQKYANAYSTSWYDSTQINYNVKISSDNGRSWKYLSGNSVSHPDIEGMYYNGSETVSGLASPDSINSSSVNRSFTWNVSGLPAGNHIIRVEAYRNGFSKSGASYHEVPVTIKR